MIWRSGSLGAYDALSAELAGASGGGHCGCAVIVRRKQGLVLAGGVRLLNLRGDRRSMRFAGICFFLWSGSNRNTAFAAVKGDVGCVVHDHRIVDVDVGDVDRIHVHDSGVVEESAAAPFAATETDAAIAEAVVNAAVEADVWAPVAAVPNIEAVVPAPVTGSPEHADGCDHPGAGHPVVAAVIVPGPVAGRPQIAGAGADGLLVNRQRGRTDVDGDANRDSDLRGRWRREGRWNSQQHES